MPIETEEIVALIDDWITMQFENAVPMESASRALRGVVRKRLEAAVGTALTRKGTKKTGFGIDVGEEEVPERGDGCLMNPEDTSRAMEETLYNLWFYEKRGLYRHKTRLLEHNLLANGWNLLVRYGPELLCSLPGEKLAEGTPIDVWRKESRLQLLNDLKPPTPKGTEAQNGLFRCYKCHGRRTTFYSRQILSADENMTVFVFCMDCEIQFKR